MAVVDPYIDFVLCCGGVAAAAAVLLCLVVVQYRGPCPLEHTLLNGDTKTAVSVIKIDPSRFDVGPIVSATETPVDADETLPMYVCHAVCHATGWVLYPRGQHGHHGDGPLQRRGEGRVCCRAVTGVCVRFVLL